MVRMARMRRTATKHYDIKGFDQIGAEGGYRTPTGFRFMIRTEGNETRIYFDNHTNNLIVAAPKRNGFMSIDDMDRPYMTFDSNNLANEMKELVVGIGAKHGLE